jgi:hypothetical protein
MEEVDYEGCCMILWGVMTEYQGGTCREYNLILRLQNGD